MRHKFLTAALLALAALALRTDNGQAQFGFSVGGRNFGLSVGTPYYGYGGYGGYRGLGYSPYNSYYGSGYSPYQYGYGYSPWAGYNSGRGYVSPGYYAPRNYYGYGDSSGGNPYYNTPSYSSTSPNAYSPTYGYSSPAYGVGGSAGYYNGGATGGSSTSAYGSLDQATNKAWLNVRLPAEDAEVWVQGVKTQSQGTWRQYVSPPLDPTSNYTYEVRARWTGPDGQSVERTRTVPVTANGMATVDFTAMASTTSDHTLPDANRPAPASPEKRTGDRDRPIPDR